MYNHHRIQISQVTNVWFLVVPHIVTSRACSVQVLPLATRAEIQRTASWQFSSVDSANWGRHCSQFLENRTRL